jgi:hypothetical protein
MSRLFLLAGLLALADACTVCVLHAADSASSGSGNISAIAELKPGKGRELVLVNCIPCHSTAVIASSHQTREGWDQTITKMQKQNGLWPIAPSMRAQILDYLEATQPPSDPGLDKGKESPWATPLYRPNPLW